MSQNSYVDYVQKVIEAAAAGNKATLREIALAAGSNSEKIVRDPEITSVDKAPSSQGIDQDSAEEAARIATLLSRSPTTMESLLRAIGRWDATYYLYLARKAQLRYAKLSGPSQFGLTETWPEDREANQTLLNDLNNFKDGVGLFLRYGPDQLNLWSSESLADLTQLLFVSPQTQCSLGILLDETPSRWLLAYEAPEILRRRMMMGQTVEPWDGADSMAGPGPTPLPIETDSRELAFRRRFTGLSFSGGGIRSATFSLGVLQAMSQLNFLENFDYVSSVSGGGYIHEWFAAWLKRTANLFGADGSNVNASSRAFAFVQNALIAQPARGKVEVVPPEISFLRRYSNYLTPRIGLMGLDTWTMITIWLRNMSLNLVVILSATVGAVALLRLTAYGFRGKAGYHPVCSSTSIQRLLTEAPPYSAAWGIFLRCLNCVRTALPTTYHLADNAAPLVFDAVLITLLALFIPAIIIIGVELYFVHSESSTETGPDKKPASPPKKTQNLLAGLDRCFSRHFPTWKEWTGVALLFCAACTWTLLIWRTDPPDLLFDKWFPSALILFGISAWQHFSGTLEEFQARNKYGKVHSFLYATLLYLAAIPLAAFGGLTLSWVTNALSTTAPIVSRTLWQAAYDNLTIVRPLLVAADNFLTAHPEMHSDLLLITGPPLFLSVFFLCVLLHHGLEGRNFDMQRREWMARIRAACALWCAFWMLGFIVTLYGPLLLSVMFHSMPVLFSAVSGLLSLGGVLAGKSSKASGDPNAPSSLTSMSLEKLAIAGCYSFIAAYFISIAWLVSHFTMQWHDGLFYDNPQLLLYTLLVSIAVFAIWGWRVDVNEFSMQALYRNRLTRCYLGASTENRKPNPFTGLDPRDGKLRVGDLAVSGNYPGPFPIFCATMNLTAGEDLGWQERKGASFAFTPLTCGYDALWHGIEDRADMLYNGYRATKDYGCDGGTKLATAVATSGAAASPAMGYHTNPGVAFALTFWNVRLGWWFRNTRFKNIVYETRRDPDSQTAKSAWDEDRGQRRLPPSPPWPAWYLCKEMFCRIDEKDKFVYLTDGGHFDNMGLYELVRRRCKYIVVCDGEADGSAVFSGIAMGMRNSRTDFGVEIDLDLESMLTKDRRDGQPIFAKHFCIGRIDYPEESRLGKTEPSRLKDCEELSADGAHEPNVNSPEPSSKKKAPNNCGYILYLKATLNGDEPGDIQSYAKLHKEFPNDSTANQWFTESEFESYRRLGQFIAQTTLYKTDKQSIGEALEQLWCQELNLRARIRKASQADQVNKLAMIERLDANSGSPT